MGGTSSGSNLSAHSDGQNGDRTSATIDDLVIEGALLLDKFPRDVAENLSVRELIRLSEGKNRTDAGKLLAMLQMIYHSAISPNSKQAVKHIQKMAKRLEGLAHGTK